MRRNRSKTAKPRVNMTLDQVTVNKSRVNAEKQGFGSLSELTEHLLEAHDKALNGVRKSAKQKLIDKAAAEVAKD